MGTALVIRLTSSILCTLSAEFNS